MVELALVVPLLLSLCAGTFEFGMAWRASLSAQTAVRAATRIGSQLGPDPMADYYSLTALRASLLSAGLLNGVVRVVIFRSDTTDGKVPSTCAGGTAGSDKCIVVSGSQLQNQMTQANFAVSADGKTGTGCYTPAVVQTWCPSARINMQITAEYLGVWVQLQQGYFTREFGSGVTIQRTSVMRLEPKFS